MKTLFARSFCAAIALLFIASAPAEAHRTAQPVSIEGNWYIALIIAFVALVSLILLIRGVLFIDRRDAWLRRGAGDGDWWISD